MIPIAQEDREFFKSQWKDRSYQFNCLLFGLISAPWVFTKTTRQVMATLWELGLIVYIDDILVMAETRVSCHGSGILAGEPGGRDQPLQIRAEPHQEREFLGFTLNSTKMELKLPREKIKKIRAKALAGHLSVSTGLLVR